MTGRTDINERCVAVADTVVPKYRNGTRAYSCCGHVAKMWQAAYEGAEAVLAATPASDAAVPAGEPLLAREIAAQFYDKRDPLDPSYRDIAHDIRRGRLDDQDAVELVRFALAYTAAAPKVANDTEPCGYCGRTSCRCDRTDLCEAPGCDNTTDHGICGTCDQWVSDQVASDRGAGWDHLARAKFRADKRAASGEVSVEGSIYEGMEACLVQHGRTIAHVVLYADAVDIAARLTTPTDAANGAAGWS